MHRIRFANQLRGLAALSVACSHLVGVFWAVPAVVSATTFSPAPDGPVPAIFGLASKPWFNFGPFGVGIFFLISGLVVPISLERHSRFSFMLARVVRIYPTYCVVLLLNVAVLHLASWAWSRPYTYSVWALATNAALVYDLVGHPSIDLVNWTLSVELKFYLLVAVAAPLVRRGSVVFLIAAALGIFALNALITHGGAGPAGSVTSTPGYTASSQSVCLSFMLLGLAFNFHLRGRLSTPGLVGLLAVLSGLFVAAWRVSVWRDQYPGITVNYGYALALFGGLYAVRHHVPPNRLLDAMAAISFPFYVLHVLLGFSILRALMVGAGWGYYPALLATMACVTAVAWLVHRFVEVPCIQIGRRLGQPRVVPPAAAIV
jgi:peptidoglycan/LPS O-acetylase OafA/YrhL